MNRGVDALVVAGAVGAGVHAALVPDHLREWAPLGAAFLAAAVALGAGVCVLAVRPADARASRAVALVLATLVAGYVTTRFAAVPPLDPEREPFDLLGICTSAIEAAGLLLALPHTLVRGGTR
ncbi:MAG TPA: hypothetical protein VFL60_04055 [Gaiellaceae bacterium]|nr:hypothetical protein [Gaiellaceae bacterium]